MPSVGTASIDLTVDKDQVGKNITGGLESASSGIAGTAKRLAGVFVGAFAISKGITFFKESIEEAQEAAKVARQTEAVLTSTKSAAGLTSKEIGDYATKLSTLAGVDDELIQSGENVLLTFTNIKNGAGKGNDIFNQATLAALNMSSALGTDLQGSIVQVGKALNDPIKGITALSRVGVSFTEQQKEQIKTLVESGKTMEAQKLILKELGTEFGGAAKAAADPAQRFSVVWGNFKEWVGGLLLPVLNVVLSFFADKIPVAVDKAQKILGPIFDKIATGVRAFVAAFKEGDVTSDGFVGQMEKLGNSVRDFYDNAKPVIDWVKDNWQIAFTVAAAAILLITSPITLVIAAVVGLYVKFEWFRDGVNAVIGYVIAKAKELGDWFQQILPMIQEAIGHFVSIAQAAWHLFGDDILNVAKAIWAQIQNVIDTALTIVQNVIKLVLAIINGDWSAAWDAIKGIVGAAFGYILNTVKNGFDLVKGVFGGAMDLLKSIVMIGIRGIVDSFLGMSEWIIKAAATAFGWIPGIGGKLKEAAQKFEEFRDDVNVALGGIKDKTVTVKINTQGAVPEADKYGTYGYGPVNGRNAAGGPVRPWGRYVVGERGREVLQMGSEGGYVVPNTKLGDLEPMGTSASGGTTEMVHIDEAVFQEQADIKMVFAEARWAKLVGDLG